MIEVNVLIWTLLWEFSVLLLMMVVWWLVSSVKQRSRQRAEVEQLMVQLQKKRQQEPPYQGFFTTVAQLSDEELQQSILEVRNKQQACYCALFQVYQRGDQKSLLNHIKLLDELLALFYTTELPLFTTSEAVVTSLELGVREVGPLEELEIENDALKVANRELKEMLANLKQDVPQSESVEEKDERIVGGEMALQMSQPLA
ncbi:MAG: hypothetical protein Q9N68_03405 [Gammaproteobacteria bacterium]|nr:hypothetical protein [Gammaproteobacteria bacterium]